jgi:Protein of unknown function (DUF2938)
MSEIVLRVVLIGIGATLVMDAWGLTLRHVFGVAGLSYGMVGRWIGHMPHGRFGHDAIAKSAPVPAESAIGWIAHYAIGIAFAAGLVAVRGVDWLRAPDIGSALLTGLVTLVAPFLVMQPAFGLGIAASRTSDPTQARLRSLMTHLVFGIGLYAAGRLMAAF